MKLKSAIFILFACGFMACSQRQEPTISWYHWSSSVYTGELKHFQEVHHAEKMYVRIFDVKWNALYGPYPESIFSGDLIQDSVLRHYVPVVYITNESMLRTHMDSIPILHQRMQAEIHHSLAQHFPKGSVNEWQFDCDWTDNSKEKYFELLRLFKESEDVQISATVKLYQYAYRQKAGIPPCDRAVLMCYNIHSPKDLTVQNSIFDGKEMLKYLKKADYPIPVDIALPCYSWAVWFHDGHFEGLMNATRIDDLSSWPLVKVADHQYQFTQGYDDYVHYFQKGDILRMEAAGPDAFLPYAKQLSKHFNDSTSTIILYDFDQFNSSNYANDTLFSAWMAAAFRY